MPGKNKIEPFHILNVIFFLAASSIAILPLLIVLASSFSSERSIMVNGYSFIPKEWSVAAYKIVFGKGSSVINAYKITFFVTIVGTITAVFITTMMAYAISRKCLRYRNILSLIAYIPMVFSGGLVPFYITLVKLHLQDNLLGLILPLLVSPFNLFLILNYFRGLPESFFDAAKVDGAGEFRIYSRIVLPLAIPGIATILLFYALGYWNEWFLALLLIENQKLYPLQYLLRRVLSSILFVQMGQTTDTSSIPAESTKMATVVVTVGPIIFLYPFIQKYFIKGITIGGVKG